MTNHKRLLAILAVGLALVCAVGCNKLQARDQLNKGVQAYKNAKYEEAIDHFQKAVSLDPNLLNARLYLATAFAQQYIPGADTPDNNQVADQAIDQFKKVLDMHPGRDQKTTSLKGIASLYFNMKKMNDAKDYHRKVVELDPNDPEAYYSIGVIDWTEAYQNAAEAKSKEGMKVDDDITKNKKLCPTLKQENEQLVQDGIDNLNKALQLRPDYDDAMAYMNLMYRRKADLECGDPDARAADLKAADDWVDKTMATKKAKTEKQPGATGITMDQSNK
jgi:tetratricopeptide (TPR) repeat protein